MNSISKLTPKTSSTRQVVRPRTSSTVRSKHKTFASEIRVWGTLVFWYLVIVVLFSPYLSYRPHPHTIGAISDIDIPARMAFSVINKDENEKAELQLLEKRQEIWIRNTELEDQARQYAKGVFELLGKTDLKNADDLDKLLEDFEHTFKIILPKNTVLQLTPNQLRSLPSPLLIGDISKTVDLILNTLFTNAPLGNNRTAYLAQFADGVLKLQTQRGIPLQPIAATDILWSTDELQNYLATLIQRYYPSPDEASLRQAIEELLIRLIKPSITLDRERTQKIYEQAFNELERNPIMQQYSPDSIIAKKGEPLTRLQADALEKLNQLRIGNLQKKMLGELLIVAVFFVFSGALLKLFRKEAPINAQMITVHVLPPLLVILTGLLMIWNNANPGTLMVWYPSALIGITCSILMAPISGFILTFSTTCLFAIITNQPLAFILFAFLGSFSAILTIQRIRMRYELIKIGFVVGVVNLITILTLNLLTPFTVDQPRFSMLAAFFNGPTCAFAAMAALLLFERVFGIVTDLKLLELTGLKHPLLAQFEEKAPGSYQHVLNVTKLAEAAAQAVDANVLLVRAGCYFHDVGKMLKPKYFTENQVSPEEQKLHSRISPNMSVLIIRNHVKDGVDLAKRYKLPPQVIDFIPQHHGTSLIRYFYIQAQKRYAESGGVSEPHEDEFRYPGPKPQSIETAIVMIADSVEATATSRFPGGLVSEDELRRLAQGSISEKFNDGQFDDCNLTLKHLHLIREALVRTLMARYHFRIAYPSSQTASIAKPQPKPLAAAQSPPLLPIQAVLPPLRNIPEVTASSIPVLSEKSSETSETPHLATPLLPSKQD